MIRSGRIASLVAPLTFAAALAPCPVAASSLEPYQMVRSLQLLQDTIAAGDHAALPLQRKLLEMIDGRFRSARSEDFADARNFRALLVYGMSGGNPATVKAVLSRLPPEVAGNPAAAGILSYLEGANRGAMDALAEIEPMAQPGDLGACLALIMGTVIGTQDPAAGLPLLDKARLLGPGTLVEEAALRRSIAMSVTLQDPERFLRASNQYARRFLRSPYATQFAESFISGVTTLFAALDRTVLVETISEMTREHQKAVYLWLARSATIDGPPELGEFAAAGAAQLAAADPQATPRAALYSTIASIRGDTIEDFAQRLNAIDRNRLSRSDRRLLDAALAVAKDVLAAPDWAQEPAKTAAATALPADSPAIADEADPVQAVVDDARNRLESIDRLLEGTGG